MKVMQTCRSRGQDNKSLRSALQKSHLLGNLMFQDGVVMST